MKYSKSIIVAITVVFSMCFANAAAASASEAVKRNPSPNLHLVSGIYDTVLSADEISDFSQQELCYARNEIYARYGRKFKSTELSEYFSLMPWYEGRTEPDQFDEQVLSETDKKNAETIIACENQKFGGAYQTDQTEYDIFKVRTLGGGKCRSARDVMLQGVLLKLPDAFYMDLDGDGTGESVQYEASEGSSAFVIDGSRIYASIEYPDQYPYGVSLDGRSVSIIMCDLGPSDDPRMHFIDYRNGDSQEIGVIEDFPADITADPGEGIIYGSQRASGLGSWSYECRWQADPSGFLELIPQKQYLIRTGSGTAPSVEILRPVSIYKDRDMTSPSGTAAPQKAKKMYTDNEGWVFISAEDGTEGWYPVPGRDELREIFSGISYAD